VNESTQIGHKYVGTPYVPERTCSYARAPRSNQSRFFKLCPNLFLLIVPKGNNRARSSSGMAVVVQSLSYGVAFWR
jgi:hypothetical protein